MDRQRQEMEGTFSYQEPPGARTPERILAPERPV